MDKQTGAALGGPRPFGGRGLATRPRLPHPNQLWLTFTLTVLGMTLLYVTLWRYELAAKNARIQLRVLRRRLLGEETLPAVRRSAAPS